MTTKKPSGVLETIRTVIYAVLIAMVVRTFAYEPFNIPSKSMVPTLLVGDYLFVSKFSYGYSRFSLPFGLPLFEGRIWHEEPERGDVIVFKLPRDNDTDYIKRLVGLPGDTIQVIGGILHINGVPVERERVEDYDDDGVRVTQYLETLPEGMQHRIVERSDGAQNDNTPPFVVPAGHYFMMGDNRDNSLDSRVPPEQGGVGFVPAENLIGRADILFFSTDGSASLWEVWKWPGAIRFARIFDPVS
jgi:signal peptidase I